MPRQDFIESLTGLGYSVTDLGNGLVWIPYVIQFGPRIGEEVRLGFQVGDDWPMNPPTGPHVSPQILPINPGGVHPNGAIQASPFGPDWEYWSRPYPNPPGWASTPRTLITYLRHIAHLFRTL